MFNYFTYMKQKEEIEKRIFDDEKQRSKSLQRQKMNFDYVNNYENRIRSFLEKAASKDIQFKDTKSGIINPREEFLKEGLSKIAGRKEIIFKEFTTEKQRLVKFLIS